MSLSLIILLTILIIFLICFIYIEPIISKHKIKNNNEYGSARFSTFNEINKNFTKEKISNINEVGFPVYYDKNISHHIVLYRVIDLILIFFLLKLNLFYLVINSFFL